MVNLIKLIQFENKLVFVYKNAVIQSALDIYGFVTRGLPDNLHQIFCNLTLYLDGNPRLPNCNFDVYTQQIKERE